jgi:hypothetical protein
MTAQPTTVSSQGSQATHRARGVLVEQGPDFVVMGVPGTDYRLRLAVYKPVDVAVGKRLVGTIRATARRVDVVGTGGAYIEPVYGEPRRVQGSILATSAADQTITVHAGVPVQVRLGAGQRPDQFAVGAMVSFDVLSGTSLTPA